MLVPHVHLGAFAEEGLDRDRVAVAAREVQRGDVVGGLGRHLARHAGARFSWETRRCGDALTAARRKPTETDCERRIN